MRVLKAITITIGMVVLSSCTTSDQTQAVDSQTWKKAHYENSRIANQSAQQQINQQRSNQQAIISQQRARVATPPTAAPRPVFTSSAPKF